MLCVQSAWGSLESSFLEMRLGSADTSRKPPVLALQNIAALYIDQGTRQLLCETAGAPVFKASIYVPCFCFLISITFGLPDLQIKMDLPIGHKSQLFDLTRWAQSSSTARFNSGTSWSSDSSICSIFCLFPPYFQYFHEGSKRCKSGF